MMRLLKSLERCGDPCSPQPRPPQRSRSVRPPRRVPSLPNHSSVSPATVLRAVCTFINLPSPRSPSSEIRPFVLLIIFVALSLSEVAACRLFGGLRTSLSARSLLPPRHIASPPPPTHTPHPHPCMNELCVV